MSPVRLLSCVHLGVALGTSHTSPWAVAERPHCEGQVREQVSFPRPDPVWVSAQQAAGSEKGFIFDRKVTNALPARQRGLCLLTAVCLQWVPSAGTGHLKACHW